MNAERQQQSYTIDFRKGDERYVIIIYRGQHAEALRLMGRWASNPDLSFTWYDAAMLSAKVRADAAAAGGKV